MNQSHFANDIYFSNTNFKSPYNDYLIRTHLAIVSNCGSPTTICTRNLQ